MQRFQLFLFVIFCTYNSITCAASFESSIERPDTIDHPIIETAIYYSEIFLKGYVSNINCESSAQIAYPIATEDKEKRHGLCAFMIHPTQIFKGPLSYKHREFSYKI